MIAVTFPPQNDDAIREMVERIGLEIASRQSELKVLAAMLEQVRTRVEKVFDGEPELCERVLAALSGGE